MEQEHRTNGQNSSNNNNNSGGSNSNNNIIINNNDNDNNNYDIHRTEGPSTSRQHLSTVRTLSNQFDERAFRATIRSRPLPGKTHIVEYRNPVKPELDVHVTAATEFHGVNTTKIGVCMYMKINKKSNQNINSCDFSSLCFILKLDPMRSPKRGILIIVNNIHFLNKPWLRRNGAETDRDNLVYVFRQMGFFVCVQEDLTKLVSKIPFQSIKMFILFLIIFF